MQIDRRRGDRHMPKQGPNGFDVRARRQDATGERVPEHVKGLKALADDASGANSAQTVAPVPHNHHAWNQRTKTADRVSFVFHAERSEAYNKQRKPAYYVFGNLVAARSAALLSGMDFFAEPSVAMDILRPYDFDLDTQDDIVVAEALIASAAVSLPHMNSEVL